MRSAVGRADLARLLGALDEAQARRAARALGFEPATTVVRPEIAAAMAPTAAPPAIARAPSGPVPFWHAASMEYRTLPTVEAERQPGLTPADLTTPGASLFRTPRPLTLTPWSRLWPRLRALLPSRAPGRDPDLVALARELARGLPLGRIPPRSRRTWAASASVWIDLDARLVPFESDQYDVLARLRRALGRSGLTARGLTMRAQTASIAARGDLLAGVRIDPGVPVIVLGDLGAYAGSAALAAAWHRTARRLAWHRVPVAALVPAPTARGSRPTARAWRAISWERAAAPATLDPEIWRGRAERLLRLVSPAAYLQPGLLRALRRLLPAPLADASTEADVWSHADVRAANAGGLVLRPAAAARWRDEFATSSEISDELRQQVSDTIGHWHAGLPSELLRAETLAWHAMLPSVPPPGDLDDALGFARRVAESARTDDATASIARRYGQVVTPALPGRAFAGDDVGRLLVRLYATSFHGVENVEVPAGIDPATLLDEIRRIRSAGPPFTPRRWSVRQVGGTLRFNEAPPSGAWSWGAPRPGSPVGWLRAAGPELIVSRRSGGAAYGQRTRALLHDELAIELRPGEDVYLDVDLSALELTIAPSTAAWAIGEGRDQYGLWADAEILGVVQRFRFIPPGRGRIGSPRDEAGRDDDEGPLHQVTWTRGYWLADTPITQALWQAVMGYNPSQFQSSTRPVDRVSHDDCVRFLERLALQSPDLAPRLPTEAEWEYACRAGTDTATWLGDLAIVGDNHAPILDAIAWYGGNSGHGYELANGFDSSGWPSKQYPHTNAGTRAVATRAANPFGLFDMLGNVFEWCVDGYDVYEGKDVTDPAPHTPLGAFPVLRGGSWYCLARDVRAARRCAHETGLRESDIGFRLARGQQPRQGMEYRPRSGVVRAAGRGPAKRRGDR